MFDFTDFGKHLQYSQYGTLLREPSEGKSNENNSLDLSLGKGEYVFAPLNS